MMRNGATSERVERGDYCFFLRSGSGCERCYTIYIWTCKLSTTATNDRSNTLPIFFAVPMQPIS